VSRLADPTATAPVLAAGRAELLLAMGDRRLSIAGDLDGARRAYALAGGVLEGVDDPAYLSLRQTLQQERAALDALGVEPRARAVLALDAFAAALVAAPPRATAADHVRLPWWERAFASIVEVQPAADGSRCSPPSAPPRRPACNWNCRWRVPPRAPRGRGYRAALVRAGSWLARLWPPSPALQRQQAQLDALAALPLSLSVPTWARHWRNCGRCAHPPRGSDKEFR